MTAQTVYKWESPRAWLIDYLSGLDIVQLFRETMLLIDFLDDDNIQDLYQDDMDRDGYFEEVDNE